MLKFRPDAAARSKLQALSRGLSGWDDALPDTYGMSPASLVALLNEYMRGAAQQEDGAAEARKEDAHDGRHR